MSSPSIGRHHCEHPGCDKSYLRSEHLNRHRLTHKQRAFACYVCKKPFTRNDLLQVHLRRHQNRNFENVETLSQATSPQEGHRNALLRRTDPESLTLGIDRNTYSLLQSSRHSPFVDAEQPVDASTDGMVDVNTTVQHQDVPFPTISLDILQQQFLDEREAPQQLDFPWLFQHTGLFDPLGRDTPPHFQENLQFESEPVIDEASPLATQIKEPWISHTDYQRMLVEFPELEAMNLGDNVSLLQLFYCGLDYLDICMPFFHRQTLKFSSMSPLVILAVCSLGAFLSPVSGAQYTGRLLHKHVWQRTYANVLEDPQVDVSVLQAMVVIEHVGYYTSTRHDHEMAIVMHGIILTLSRRSNLLTSSFSSFRNHQEAIESQWKKWAKQETIIRLAYSIFIYDVSHSIHFMHSSLLSVGMLKLPLPSSQTLWQAKTATEWEEEMARSGLKSVPQTASSMQASMRLLLATRNEDLNSSQQALQEYYSSDPFVMQILIHGIASAVLEHSRAMYSTSSQVTHLLKVEDFKVALARWHNWFGQMNPDNRATEMSVSALVTYHFASILLHENLSTIMVAAGAAYAEGSSVTSQRAQESFVPLITTKLVRKEAFTHALEIIGLCLEDRHDPSLLGKSPQSAAPQPMKPLHMDYTAFIAVLVLWAYVLGVQHMQWMLQHGGRVDGTSPETAMTGRSRSDGIDTGGSTRSDINENMLVVMQLLEREQHRDTIDTQELEAIKADVRRLIHTIRDALASVSWEISLEASQILESLVEKDDFAQL